MDIKSLYQDLPEVLKPFVIAKGDFTQKELRRVSSEILIDAALIKLGRRKIITRNEAIHILTHPVPFTVDMKFNEMGEGFLYNFDNGSSLKYEYHQDGDYMKITRASIYLDGSFCSSYPDQRPALYHIPTKTFERDLDMNYDKYDEGLQTTFVTQLIAARDLL